ncbi:MAG: glycosyl hydrolase, partial [Draconibacterium sp.]|nr:glycosyl hydrolase [Draconibacterium sp.]
MRRNLLVEKRADFIRFIVKAFCLATISVGIFASCKHQPSNSFSEEEFKNPSAEYKPRTWFHAMSGNMTKAGLTKDLEAIERVGIGGILLFNVTQGIPNGPIKYNSSEHHEMIKHAAAECERLGLSFGVHNCDGWSSSGGPWITPEQSMKMVVWSETITKGGEVNTKLNQPTIREGFYEDIAVFAYPALETEIFDYNNPYVVTSSDKNFKTEILTDNRLDETTKIEKQGDENPWIQYKYTDEMELRSVFLVFNDRHGEAVLQISDDGNKFETVRELYKVRTGKGEWAINDSFKPIKSKYFRLQLNQTMTFKEAKLLSTSCLHNVLGRTSIARTEDRNLTPIGNPAPEMIIDKSHIINLTADLDEDGNLKTTLPEGIWTIMRFGYTSTGAFNHP